ncbi:carboxymuconolactone decarboxylase family protein [Schlesneria sp. T3-172]|uniref:carboxymuconolactone decarboxylase family protein n=1 Tax=Schlesneria sphaerica TaxID=3373610 RepID=UPI0037C505E3
MKKKFSLIAAGLVLSSSGFTYGIDSKTTPRPVPLTRPEMKEYLEDMKSRTPRIPLPELTEEDKEKLGERGGSYEGRLRYHYMPGGDLRGTGTGNAGRPGTGLPGGGQGFGGGGGGGRDNDPDNTLSYKFKVQLFWIVSRTNNCQYCLGHQESKLLAAGMTEDEIAALDSEWEAFPEAEQAAFAFARKFTYEPHLLGDADIAKLRAHFTDQQILEMILSMAGNNSINRWKEGAGVPQSANGGGFGRRQEAAGQGGTTQAAAASPRHESYLTPTAARFQNKVTKVAPLLIDLTTSQPTRQTVSDRPPLETRSEVETGLEAAKQRTPRLPLVEEAKAREFVSSDWPEGPLPQWVRLLANFPNSAKNRIAGIQSAETRGDLTPLIKAQVSWIIARQDRAWYATGLAKQRLKELGQSEDQIYALDGDWSEFTPTERSLFNVAKKLATTPVVLTDEDVDAAVKLAGPRDVVQLISYTTNRASFDRITEAAGLALE